jgi:hypothetical protein
MSVCCIYDSNIVIASFGIHIYNFEIINGEIHVINKKFIPSTNKIYEIFNFKNYIVFADYYNIIYIYMI